MTKRILIIEDQEDNRAIMRDLLTGAGFELIEAADGEEGVKLIASACQTAGLPAVVEALAETAARPLFEGDGSGTISHLAPSQCRINERATL